MPLVVVVAFPRAPGLLDPCLSTSAAIRRLGGRQFVGPRGAGTVARATAPPTSTRPQPRLRRRRQPAAAPPRDGRDVLLLNPDAHHRPPSAVRASAGAGPAPRLAAVAPAQPTRATVSRDRVVWPFPTPGGAWLEAVGLGGSDVVQTS